MFAVLLCLCTLLCGFLVWVFADCSYAGFGVFCWFRFAVLFCLVFGLHVCLFRYLVFPVFCVLLWFWVFCVSVARHSSVLLLVVVLQFGCLLFCLLWFAAALWSADAVFCAWFRLICDVLVF